LAAQAAGLCDYDLLSVAGGDGTVNRVINALLPQGISVPLAIIPTGTANDFASYLKIPTTPEDAVRSWINGRVIQSDVGFVNGRYFLNVCGSGVFVNISELVNADDKDALGKYAYYLKGIEQLPGLNPFSIRIKTRTRVYEADVFMYFILNSPGVGGFTNISPEASIQDGLFELIAVKAIPVMELAMLLLKLYKGNMINDDRVLYLQEPYFFIENLSSDSEYTATGIDGEKGPDMPIEAANLQKKLMLLVPNISPDEKK